MSWTTWWQVTLWLLLVAFLACLVKSVAPGRPVNTPDARPGAPE